MAECETRFEMMDVAAAPGHVAAAFAARQQAWEDEQLSDLAARSYPAQRRTFERRRGHCSGGVWIGPTSTVPLGGSVQTRSSHCQYSSGFQYLSA